MNLRLAAVLAAATLAGTSTGASAAPVCRTVEYGSEVSVTVCVDADPGLDRTTVAPTVTVTCGLGPYVAHPHACSGTTVGAGQTGFIPSRGIVSNIEVDTATGSVRIQQGGLGRLYVDGTSFPVPTDTLCIGDPAFCS